MLAQAPAIPLIWVLILLALVCALAAVVMVLSGVRTRRVELALEEARRGQQAALERAAAAEALRDTQLDRIVELGAAVNAARQDADHAQREHSAQLELVTQQLAAVQSDSRTLQTRLESERQQSQEKLALLLEAREQLSQQFKTLAADILDEKTRKFTEQNQLNLGALLTPLSEQIKVFKAKVEEVYVNEGKDRSALKEQVQLLTQLNNTLSQDTQNLTLALKGDRKAQGNFGEIILDDVLEKAGLIAGQHYVKQGGVTAADGQGTSIPDVVITLPGERYLVVDSKMTLPDYRAFADAQDDGERSVALKRHLVSIRAHIKGLSDKKYQTLYDLKSLDFVVMFVPLEPAFTVAVTHDAELFQHAWEKNVLLVSPSTLLFVVRTVANLWRQEDLSRNAKDISAQGAKLYDKLVGFVNDLDEVGKRIQQAQDSYGDARRKLKDGSGNLIGQAEKLRKLGVKPAKMLSSAWVESTATEELPPPDSDQPK
ncbi:MAG: DNA recombination protein RmuC [Panacagrimonas sp.]